MARKSDFEIAIFPEHTEPRLSSLSCPTTFSMNPVNSMADLITFCGTNIMASPDDTDRLLTAADNGDQGAVDALLNRYRARLRRMVDIHFDRRIAARTDASDVVQETLLEAHRRLPVYLRDRPIPFYVWLRRMARNRMIDLHRRHIKAQRRSVHREVGQVLPVTDNSVQELAQAFFVSGTSPSGQVGREEELSRLRAAFETLDPIDREVLTLRYLERASAREAGEAMGISENTFTKRHIRTITRLRKKLSA